MSFTTRFAEPKDAASFSRWAGENPNIPHDDLTEFCSHPTSKTLVVEKDGIPVMFFPLWALIEIGFLGFNPEAAKEDKLAALNVAMEALANFAKAFGIAEAQFTSSATENYPMLRWSRNKGFKKVDKHVFKVRVE